MQRYIAKRIFYGLISVWLLTIIIFLAIRITGDPARIMAEPGAGEEDLQLLRKKFGLDRPIHFQYYTFISKIARGDFGNSFQYKYPCLELYLQRLPNSIQLGLSAFIISLVLGIPLGIISAIKVNTLWDKIASTFGVLGMSMPGFWLGMLFILIFSVKLGVMPSGGMGSLKHLVMPAFSLGWYFTAAHLRMVRSSMLEVLGTDYVKFARLKGVPEVLVVVKHSFKNALLPVVTLAGINLVLILNVTVIVEIVFSWPGIGRLLYQSIIVRDFPMVQTITLVAGIMMVVINLFVDILYALIDPRIRYERPSAH